MEFRRLIEPLKIYADLCICTHMHMCTRTHTHRHFSGEKIMFLNSNIPKLRSPFFNLLSLNFFHIYMNHKWYLRYWHAIFLSLKSCRMRPTIVRTFLAIEQIRSQCIQRAVYTPFLGQKIDYKRSMNLKYSLDFPISIYWLKLKSHVPFFCLNTFL